ncbi:sigma-B activity negative regulator [Nostoc carneum NIES-2107]|nr:sigma-B activity negative regulator [Nostoc carneum NIES-2107]
MSSETSFLISNSSLQVASDINAITIVLDWFDQFNCSPLTNRVWIEGQTGLIEGFTNVVRHAHKHLSPQTPIDLSVQISAEYFQLCIWDRGDIFNLETALEKLSEQTSNQTFNPLDQEAHWGCIFLLKLRDKYSWKISYTRDFDARNCLLLRKELVPQSGIENSKFKIQN